MKFSSGNVASGLTVFSLDILYIINVFKVVPTQARSIENTGHTFLFPAPTSVILLHLHWPSVLNFNTLKRRPKLLEFGVLIFQNYFFYISNTTQMNGYEQN